MKNKLLIALLGALIPLSANAAINATTAEIAYNLASGTNVPLYGVLYQAGNNKTYGLAPGTAGYVLTSNGPGLPPSWTAGGGGGGGGGSVPGGFAGQVLWQSAPSTTTFTAIGAVGQSLISGGSGSPTWGVPAFAAASGTASTATALAGGSAFRLPYQTGSSATGFLPAGSAGQVLTSNGPGSAPSWASAAATTGAGSINGGSAGQVLFQVSPNNTSFTATGSSGQSLISNGASTPTWGVPALATTAAKANNIAGGSARQIPYQTGSGTTSFTNAASAGQVLVANGSGIPTWSTLSSTTAQNLLYGTAGAVPYQSAPNVTAFTAGAGASGQSLLSTGGSAPVWGVPPLATQATTAVKATNLDAGSLGQVPYQTGAGTTGFTGIGTTGQALISNGAAAPTWGVPLKTTNIDSGAANQVPYQTAVGTTTFTATPTPGQVLAANASGVPTWSTQFMERANWNVFVDGSTLPAGFSADNGAVFAVSDKYGYQLTNQAGTINNGAININTAATGGGAIDWTRNVQVKASVHADNGTASPGDGPGICLGGTGKMGNYTASSGLCVRVIWYNNSNTSGACATANMGGCNTVIFLNNGTEVYRYQLYSPAYTTNSTTLYESGVATTGNTLGPANWYDLELDVKYVNNKRYVEAKVNGSSIFQYDVTASVASLGSWAATSAGTGAAKSDQYVRALSVSW